MKRKDNPLPPMAARRKNMQSTNLLPIVLVARLGEE
jgi:hypothetical protein